MWTNARIADGHVHFVPCDCNNNNHFIVIITIIEMIFRCQEVYGEHVNIHDGHLCGGTLNGKSGTCVGKEKKNILNWFYFIGIWFLHMIFALHNKSICCVRKHLFITLKWFVCHTNLYQNSFTQFLFSIFFFLGFLKGDSGGPLNCRLHKNSPWILAGITSFGSGCSDSSYHPDVYIRISYYIKWIIKTMSQN